MKINRFIVLAAIALLVVGAMGAVVTRSFALGSHSPVAQTVTCAQDQASGTEVTSATDTAADTGIVGVQCGDQTTLDSGTATGAEAVGAAETSASAEATSAETANESKPSDGPNGPSVQVEQTGQNDGQFGQ